MPDPADTNRLHHLQSETSLATTPDSAATYGQRAWVAYNDQTDLHNPDGKPFYNLEGVSYSLDSGLTWKTAALPTTWDEASCGDTSPCYLENTETDPWLASDSGFLVLSVLADSTADSPTDTLVVTESRNNGPFTKWHRIAYSPDLPLSPGDTTLDKPSLDMIHIPNALGYDGLTDQIAATAFVQLAGTQYLIVLGTAANVYATGTLPAHSAAEHQWTFTEIAGAVLYPDVPYNTNPIVKLGEELTSGVFVDDYTLPIYVAFERAQFDPDNGARRFEVHRIAMTGFTHTVPPVKYLSSVLYTVDASAYGGLKVSAQRTFSDQLPMGFDVARAPDRTHLWLTYAERGGDGRQHVVVADCEEHYAAHQFCTPPQWRKRIFTPSGGQGRLMQPSITASDDFQHVAVIWYQSHPPGYAPNYIEPQGRFSDDGGQTWSNAIPLANDLVAALQGNPEVPAYQPCPTVGGYYGDYIGTTYVPYDPLAPGPYSAYGEYPLSAWTDSRAGCDTLYDTLPGQYDHHVQATLW